MLRVVRLTSLTPSRCSIEARRAVAAGGVMPSKRAVADRLPCFAMSTKNSSSVEDDVFKIIE